MMLGRGLAFALLIAFLTGCEGSRARFKGELTENGQPATFPPGSMPHVVLRPLDGAGRPSATEQYKAVVTPGGFFELVGSTTEIPTGSYQFTLELSGSSREKYPHLTLNTSRVRVDLVAGLNLLQVDISR
jgi:hypothetical protein